MEIYIVRHGKTLWNKVKKFQGSTDIELSDEGRRLAELCGRNLLSTQFDRVFSSPLKRARETAKLFLGGRNQDIIIDDRLTELNFGDCEGKLFDDLVKDDSITFKYFFSKPELYIPDSRGETIEHMIERAKSFMTEVIEPLEATCSRVMIVGHGALNKGLMCHVLKHGKADLWGGGVQKNCNTIIIDYTAGEYTVIDETRLFYE